MAERHRPRFYRSIILLRPVVAALAATAALLAGSPPAAALSLHVEEIPCRVTGGFGLFILTGNGQPAGSYLDFRPNYVEWMPRPDLPPVNTPPRFMDVCLEGFPIYRTDFSEQEIERLRAHWKSVEIERLKQSASPSYLAHRLAVLIGDTISAQFKTLMLAIWEAQVGRAASAWVVSLPREPDPDLYRALASEMIAFIEANREDLDAKFDDRWRSRLLLVELLRRQGRFEDAGAAFSRLSVEELHDEHPYRAHAKRLRDLIAKRDSKARIVQTAHIDWSASADRVVEDSSR